ncbi:restriction endonuclease [Natronococcus sp. A-GB1]|uniref:restriction endonuclease n=1 Tax=Natronococcus sp. A-GB1 TaxID=3037648 RepID=UPI00241DAC02|nr:restriction endonuclease [Natronococcus sp. A-GB1]MDG5762118.1 restriction endonuclease [Natronococcus sp. A-GB1]
MLDKLNNLLSGSSRGKGDSTFTQSSPLATDDWVWERAHEYPYDHYTEAVDDIKQLKRERAHTEAENLLLWCIDFVEAEAKQKQDQRYGSPAIAPAYYRHLGIIYRKDDRHRDEVEILNRYVTACRNIGTAPQDDMVDRLDRAQELAQSRSQTESKTTSHNSDSEQSEIQSLEDADIKQILQGMDDYDFEYFIADLWEEQGWDCEVSQASMDAGIDVTATKSSPYSQKKLIQAKRYGPNTSVGGPDIQQYASLKHQQPDADSVVVVTSNQFTNSAKERAKDLNVKLVDGDSLERLVHKLDAYDIVREYTPHITEESETKTEPEPVAASAPTQPVGTDAEISTTTNQSTSTKSHTSNQSSGRLHSLEQSRPWNRLFLKGIGVWFAGFLLFGILDSTGIGILAGLAGLIALILFPLMIALPLVWYLDMRYVRSETDWHPSALAYLAGGLFLPYIAIPLYYYRRYKTIGI